MAMRRPQGNRRWALFPRLLLGLSVKMNLDGEALTNQLLICDFNVLANRFGPHAARDQPCSSGLIRFWNSSNDASPLIFSPLMKKVGVESTFSTSVAYFWSATSLSSSALSLRQVSTCCWLSPACLPIRVSASVVFFITQSPCERNSRSVTARYLPASPLAMQRDSIEPAAALMSSGNSRKM